MYAETLQTFKTKLFKSNDVFSLISVTIFKFMYGTQKDCLFFFAKKIITSTKLIFCVLEDNEFLTNNFIKLKML